MQRNLPAAKPTNTGARAIGSVFPAGSGWRGPERSGTPLAGRTISPCAGRRLRRMAGGQPGGNSAAGAAGAPLSVVLWGGVFLCTAIASFVGGSYHGFIQFLPPATGHTLWKVTLYATGFGSACLLGAAALAGTSGTLQRVLLAIVVFKLLFYLWWASTHDDFLFVIYDFGSALAATMLVAWLSKTGGMTAALPWLNAGAAVAVTAALIQAFKLAPHRHFNHNDLFHVVQMASLYLLYRGGMVFK